MTDQIDKRTQEIAVYMLETGATVRRAAERFGVSKSTVHKDLTERLEGVNRSLYREVRALLDRNKAERHLRGGEATRNKSQARKKKNDFDSPTGKNKKKNKKENKNKI